MSELFDYTTDSSVGIYDSDDTDDEGHEREANDQAPVVNNQGLAINNQALVVNNQLPMVTPVINPLQRSKFAPGAFRREFVSNTFTFDNRKAILGKPDLSLLTFVHDKVKQDARAPGGFVFAGICIRSYAQTMVWNNPASIMNLNRWRSTYQERISLQTVDEKFVWTVYEKDELIKSVKAALLRPEVGGRWTRINWEALTAEHNQMFAGAVADVGVPTVARVHPERTPNRQCPLHCRGGPLTKRTTLIARTSRAIENNFVIFLDRDAYKVWTAAYLADGDRPKPDSQLIDFMENSGGL